MCIGENNAVHAISYLNAQLRALWDIASQCVSAHGTYLKPDLNYRYSFALTEYFFGKHRSGAQAAVEDMWFHATLEAPTVDFVCNHEATVTVNVGDGHFNLDYLRATDSSSADRSRNQSISNLAATFRVPFRMTGIKGRDTIIGGGENTINMLVFDYNGAKLDHITPQQADYHTQCLETYLHIYLQFLQIAGHHVLFSLPDFNAESQNVTIDFSQAARTLLNIAEIQGVSIEQINQYLNTAWLKTAMLAGAQNGDLVDRPSISLAEYRSTWVGHDEDIQFHLRFGAPHVAALCDEEVLVYFTVDEAFFYDSADFSQKPIKAFDEWKVAVLFNIIRETEDEGKLIRCKIDVQSQRYMPQFSSFKGVVESDEDDTHCMNYIVNFITGEYLSILESANFHIIYLHDIRWPKLSYGFEEQHVDELEVDAEWSRNEVVEDGRTASKTTIWREITQNSDMCGFDQITALSQAAINTHYRSSWTRAGSTAAESTLDALLTKWSYQQSFQADFKPLTVRLRSDGKAIVFLHLKHGFLKPLRNWKPCSDGEEFEFEDWRLAFEVELKMCDHSALTAGDEEWRVGAEWQAAFETSRVCEQFRGHSGVDFKHIYLNFRNVAFLHELSRFEGLFTGQNKRTIDKAQAAVVYLRDHYMKHLAVAGHHILFTIPVLSNPSPELYHCLTSVIFHIYSKKTSSESGSTEQSRAAEPLIIILGMCGNRPMPASALQYSSDWVARSGRFSSLGTAAVSGGHFLKERLLPILARINANTTIIPRFSGVERDRWNLELTCWSDHPERRNEYCAFEPDAGRDLDGSLKFSWQHHDKYHYEHRGGRYTMSGRYSVSCVTENYLEIPTTYKHGTMEIKLGGSINLQLGVETDTLWQSRSAALWQASIAIHSEANGLKVTAVRSQPQFFRPTSQGETYSSLALDPELLLRKTILTTSLDLTHAVDEFKMFAQSWQSCWPGMSAFNLVQPVFNMRGDLLFELQTRATAAVANSSDSSPTSKFKPKHGNRNRGPSQPGLQPYSSARATTPSLSRQPSFEHLHVNTGGMPTQGSISRSGSIGAGLSAGPGTFSNGGSPYPNSYSATSPMVPPFSQSLPRDDFSNHSPPMATINRPMSSAGGRPASSMSNHLRTTTSHSGSDSYMGRTTSYPQVSPEQPDEMPFNGMHGRGMGLSSAHDDFEYGVGGANVHVYGNSTTSVPGIHVTDTASFRQQFAASPPPQPRSPFQQHVVQMAAPRPTSASSMRFHMSGTASGRATPVTQAQTSPQDFASAEGRRMLRDAMKQQAQGVFSPASPPSFTFPGVEMRSSSRASSRSTMKSGGMSGGASFHSSSVEHSRFGTSSPSPATGFTSVTTYE